MSDSNTLYESKEILDQIHLCTPSGRLNPDAIGWSRKPIFISNLSGNVFRKKLWNYWCITGADGMFSITISDIDYAGMVFAYYLDYATGEFQEASELIPFWKRMNMPDHPKASVEFRNENVFVEFKVPDTGEETRILVDWKNFHGRQLEAEFIINTPKSIESLNVVVPWSEKRFQYTSKQSCLPAQGMFRIGDYKKEFRESTYAVLDFGRGVWPYRCSWNWGAFSGLAEDGTLIGLNIGGKWTDGTGISENGILVNGELIKIQEPVEWNYNRKNFKESWTMRSTISDILDLKFEPFFERKAVSNMVLVYSKVHQMFGRYSGTIRAKSGNYNIEKIVGWAEEHIARW